MKSANWKQTCLVGVVLGLSCIVGCNTGGGGGGGGGGENTVGHEVIAGTNPEAGAEDAAPDALVVFTFTKPGVPGTENGSTEPPVDFDTSWSGGNTVLTVTPAAFWAEGVTYTVTLSSLSFADGTRLDRPFSLQFTVGTGERECDNNDQCPDDATCSSAGECVFSPIDGCTPMDCPFVDDTTVMAVLCMTPLPCTTNASTTEAIVVTFTQPFDFNDIGIDLLSETGQSFVVAISQSEDGTQLIATPDVNEPLLDDHTYAISIEFVSDQQGNRTDIGMDFCFSTGDELNCPSAPECSDHDATDGAVPAVADFDYSRPFGDDSVFNTLIGDNPQVDPDSDTMMARFAEVFAALGGIDIPVRKDAVPVYIADANTPLVSVELTDVSSTQARIDNVPLAPEALPDCGFDTLLAAFDPDTGTFYEFWRAVKNDDGTWRASTGASIDAGSGSGVYPSDVTAVRASGFSLAAGMIWPQELEAGLIDHALVFVFFPTRTGGPVAPAVNSDGAVDDPAALPLGALLQLDPTLDLDTLGLDPWERTIAVALQNYGMYLGDTGSGIALSLVHAYSFEGNPYEGLLPQEAITEGDVPLTKLPPESFRVLSPPSE